MIEKVLSGISRFIHWVWSIETAFLLVYIGISAATFSHTLQAAGTFFEGNFDKIPDERKGFWLLSGILFAVAVDIGMLVSSQALKKYRHNIVLVVFTVSAVASLYTQFLYAIQHVEPIIFGGGVPKDWREPLSWVINLRIFIMPSLLPLMGFMMAVSKIKIFDINEENRVKDLLERKLSVEPSSARYMPSSPAAPLKNPGQPNGEKLIPATTEDSTKVERYFFRCPECNFVGKNKDGNGYTDKNVRLRMAKKHITDNHKNLSTDADKIELLKRFNFFAQQVEVDTTQQPIADSVVEDSTPIEVSSEGVAIDSSPIVVVNNAETPIAQEIEVDSAISQ